MKYRQALKIIRRAFSSDSWHYPRNQVWKAEYRIGFEQVLCVKVRDIVSPKEHIKRLEDKAVFKTIADTLAG